MYRLRPGGRLLLLAPRSHGKTEAVISVVTQAIAENRDIRVLIVTQKAQEARERLRKIRAILETNQRLIGDYGPFKPGESTEPTALKGMKKLPIQLMDWNEENPDDSVPDGGIQSWTDSYFYVRRKSNDINPTCKAIGFNSSITGGRFDLIVFDDPTDIQGSASKLEREKALRELHDTYLPLLDAGGRAIVIGTRKHHDDLYNSCIKDPTFQCIHDKAIIQWPDHFEPIYRMDDDGRRVIVDFKVDGEAKVLCPERFPFARPTPASGLPGAGESLLYFYYSGLESGRGTTGFIREYQNEVEDEAGKLFPREFFFGGVWSPHPDLKDRVLKGCLDHRRSYLNGHYPQGITAEDIGLESADLLVYQSWDLGIVADKTTAERKDSDYTVGMTWAIDRHTWTRYLLSIRRVRGLHPNDVLALMVQEYYRFGGNGYVACAVVENNAAQRLYELDLQAHTDMTVIGHTTGREKADEYKGIPALSGLHEVGKIRYPYATPEDRSVTDIIINELNDYPNGTHDDILMCEFVGEQRAHEAHALYRADKAWEAEREERRRRRYGTDTKEARAVAHPSLEPDEPAPDEPREGDIIVRPHTLDHGELTRLTNSLRSFGGYVVPNESGKGFVFDPEEHTVIVRQSPGANEGLLRFMLTRTVKEVLS